MYAIRSYYEINRQITGRISTYHFAPTQNAKTNLTRENISPDNIYVTGNTVIDALHIVVDKLNNDSTVADKTKLKLHESGYDIESSVITSYSIHYTKLYEVCLKRGKD